MLKYRDLKKKINNNNKSAAFLASQILKLDISVSAVKWHAILGHLGPETIAHLKKAVGGAKINGRGPNTIKCQTCAQIKVHEIVSRRIEKENPAELPLKRVIWDLIKINPAYNKNKWVSHFTCYKTHIDFIYCHTRKNRALETIIEFFNIVKT